MGKEKGKGELEWKEEIVQACVKEYKSKKEDINKTAFAIVDVNKDGKLVKSEVVKALLFGTPENLEFQNAFPTGPSGMQKNNDGQAGRIISNWAFRWRDAFCKCVYH